jgi:hypothetical protein
MTPQYNGIFERKNQTIVERAKNMLLESGLSKSFSIKIVNTTNYVMNHSSSQANQSNTHKEWFKNKLDLGHLKTFGCVVLALILNPKGKQMIQNHYYVGLWVMTFA